jgi:hypothetical protein
MSSRDPWEEIAPAEEFSKLRARRVDADHPHDLYWARDSEGHRLLVFEAAELPVEDIQVPSIRGLKLDLNGRVFMIRLMQMSDLEIFTALCCSLVDRSRGARTGTDALKWMIAHLERWQRFLGRSKGGVLSEQELRGLLCELVFLDRELCARFGESAIRFWRGPEGQPQDFSLGDTAFEIKSHLVGSKPMVTISSAEQLWNTSEALHLVVYTVGEATGAMSGAMSLAQVVANIRCRLTSEVAELFEDHLLAAGYLDRQEYGRRFFTVSDPVIYHVTGTFPRITPEQVPAGICRLQYGLELAACVPFRAVPDWSKLGGNVEA